jgi:hypothetical protein
MSHDDDLDDETSSSFGVEVVVRAMKKMHSSSLETEPSTSSLFLGEEGYQHGVKKISYRENHWTRRELVLAGIGIVSFIGLIVGLAVALAPSKRATTTNPQASASRALPFPSDLDWIDSVCSHDLTSCRQACEPAKCCAGIQGGDHQGDDSCFADNPNVCLAYRKCHAVWDNNAMRIPTAPSNLHAICSSSQDKSACQEACQPAECCWNLTNEKCLEFSATNHHLLACLDYAPCQVLRETSSSSSSSSSSSLYPADTDALLHVCSNDAQTCQEECQKGSCCWDEEQDSCFPTDLVSCLTFAPCLEFPSPLPRLYARVDPPPANFQNVCHVDSILTTEGFQECFAQCQPASCCRAAAPGPYNCFDQDPLGCLQYQSCQLLDQASGDVPRAPLDLHETCQDFETLDIDDLQWCLETCQPSACCFVDTTNDDNNCWEDGNQLACREYTVCQALLQATRTGSSTTLLSSPPAQLDENSCAAETIATVEGFELCAKLCQPAACCNSLGNDNCLLDNIAVCSEWNARGCFLFASISGRNDDFAVTNQSDSLGTP